MASELVNSATSDKLSEVDWAKNIEICEIVSHDQRQAKDVIKGIKKRLGSRGSNAQLYAIVLLEMLMNNIGEAVHKQVIEVGLLPILVKIVKKKSDFPVRERIFLLLDTTQTSVGGASGKFPQYYSAYQELVNAGINFPHRSPEVPSGPPTSEAEQNSLAVANIATANEERVIRQEESQPLPGSSVIEKANAALEVLREVLDAVNAENPEVAKNEFTLDLVEQCLFQKDRVMHLAMTSRDERLVSKAIELNEQLGKVLARHEALISASSLSTAGPVKPHVGPPSTMNHSNPVVEATRVSSHASHADQPAIAPDHTHVAHEETEEEEEEEQQLIHRVRKAQTYARPKDKYIEADNPFASLSSSTANEKLHHPLEWPPAREPLSHESKASSSAKSIPPPPAKHNERERFFQDKRGEGLILAGQVKGLALYSRNTSTSSYAGSMSSNE